MTRRSPLFCLALLPLGGCNREPSAPYPVWAQPEVAYTASPGKGNAYDGYVLAAEATLKVAPSEAERVSFLSGMKKAVVAKLANALASVDRSSKLTCTFEHRAQGAFETDPNSRGWRLIGRAIVWKIESAVAAKDFSKAAHWTIVGTKFGLDLTQGDAQTATLGFAVCNEVRRALAPSYQQMSSTELNSLTSGLSGVLAKYPGMSATVANEYKRAMLGVQFVQNARQSDHYAELQKALGRDSRPAVDYLRNLSDSKRPAYFQALAASTKSFTEHWEEEIDRPRPDRRPWTPPDGYGTYRRFVEAFTGTVEPLASIADVCLARTRMFALSARGWSRVKATGLAPKDLRGLPLSLTLDPYSGNSLVYNASGPDFHVYSVGANGRDDGGDSDDAGESPDLVIEGEGS